jgi:hypothetical protein
MYTAPMDTPKVEAVNLHPAEDILYYSYPQVPEEIETLVVPKHKIPTSSLRNTVVKTIYYQDGPRYRRIH